MQPKVNHFRTEMKIQIINGPNLNLLGTREPIIYGYTSFEDYLSALRTDYQDIEIDFFQSNIEGEIVNKLHEIGFSYDAVLLNAAAYAHTSVAILDAIKAISVPVIEIHITNIHAREEFRHNSLITSACKGVIAGFGLDSYSLGVEAVLKSSVCSNKQK